MKEGQVVSASLGERLDHNPVEILFFRPHTTLLKVSCLCILPAVALLIWSWQKHTGCARSNLLQVPTVWPEIWKHVVKEKCFEWTSFPHVVTSGHLHPNTPSSESKEATIIDEVSWFKGQFSSSTCLSQRCLHIRYSFHEFPQKQIKELFTNETSQSEQT